MTHRDSDKRTNQREVVLAMLKAAGDAGVSNVQLNATCFRYGARIWELRKEYEIETRRESEGVFRFVYKGPVVRGQRQLFSEVA